MTMTYDAEVRELLGGESGEPDIYVGQNDFTAGDGRGIRQEGGMRDLVARVSNPGMSPVRAAIVAVPAVYLYSRGRSLGEQLLLAAAGAAAGAVAAHMAVRLGWVE